MRRSMRIDGAAVLAARETRQTRADPAVTDVELALPKHGELADQSDAVSCQTTLHRGPHPPQQGHRLVGKKRGSPAAAEHRKTARLVEVGGELGEELIIAQSD